MGRKPTGRPAGPTPKVVDWTLFEQLCAVQCTQSEIASMLKICSDTLRTKVVKNYGDSYSEVYKKYSECGKCSLRRNQFVLSKTNTAMAIWLGKQWLNQRDPDSVVIREESKPYIKALYETICANPFPKPMGGHPEGGEQVQPMVRSDT